MMNVTLLLEKLIDIERSIGVESNTSVRNRVIDMQDCVLEMQIEIIESLRKEPRREILLRIVSPHLAA